MLISYTKTVTVIKVFWANISRVNAYLLSMYVLCLTPHVHVWAWEIESKCSLLFYSCNEDGRRMEHSAVFLAATQDLLQGCTRPFLKPDPSLARSDPFLNSIFHQLPPSYQMWSKCILLWMRFPSSILLE